ncbi:DUF2244 domain-containing protein [Caballeronia sp. M1242]|uniref:DUF2244 domain-containing protein n=1 Tax=Caballeronia sp. M1242 TaxID=2814653 RepID=UPI0019D2B00E|nr:DUF2244 domain-containing protein [Caballeronia sp. M1242]QSN63067.1 DUF2244 domain-containing protein [Caballeronia sp. M1242]
MADTQSPRQWLLYRRSSCSPASFAIACAGLSVIPVAFASTMHALNGCVLFYGAALVHACAIWCCFFVYARHAVDGELVTLQDDVLVVESICGKRKRTHQFNTQWVTLLVAQNGAGVRLFVRSAGETVELGRYATQGHRLQFASEFQRIARCERHAHP